MQITDAIREEIHRLHYVEGLEWAVAGERYGLNADQARCHVRRWAERSNVVTTEERREQISFRETATGAIAEANWTTRIHTLEELLRVCEVDPLKWYVDHHTLNKWDGLIGDGQTEQLFQVKAYLKPTKPYAEAAQALEELKADILAHSPSYRAPSYPPRPDSPHMVEICVPDHHFGMLSWGEETGADYDSAIAEELIVTAVEQALRRARGYDIEKFLLPLGNDWLHADGTVDGAGGQTAKGTQVDVDTRWPKLFRTARRVAVSVTEMLREVAPVEVVVVPGNHDESRMFYLGEALEAWFRQDPVVTIRNDVKPRKYVLYGDNLIGFAHGHKESAKDLPLLMATEVPELWAASKIRQWHLGHLHREGVSVYRVLQEERGVQMHTLPSLVPPDAWHAGKGYVHRRASKVIVWHPTFGDVATFTVGIEEIEHAVRKAA